MLLCACRMDQSTTEACRQLYLVLCQICLFLRHLRRLDQRQIKVKEDIRIVDLLELGDLGIANRTVTVGQGKGRQVRRRCLRKRVFSLLNSVLFWNGAIANQFTQPIWVVGQVVMRLETVISVDFSTTFVN